MVNKLKRQSDKYPRNIYLKWGENVARNKTLKFVAGEMTMILPDGSNMVPRIIMSFEHEPYIFYIQYNF